MSIKMTTEPQHPSSPKTKWLIRFAIGALIALVITVFVAPMHCDYTTRTRVGEGLVLATPAKNIVADYYASHAKLSWTSGDPKARDIEIFNTSSTATRFTQSLQILSNGIIEIQYTKLVDGGGKKLLLIPEITGDKITWRCVNPPDGKITSRDLYPECRNNH